MISSVIFLYWAMHHFELCIDICMDKWNVSRKFEYCRNWLLSKQFLPETLIYIERHRCKIWITWCITHIRLHSCRQFAGNNSRNVFRFPSSINWWWKILPRYIIRLYICTRHLYVRMCLYSLCLPLSAFVCQFQLIQYTRWLALIRHWLQKVMKI